MIAAAQVRFVIPGTDVPMTLQPIAMLLIGMTLTPVCAAGGMLSYLALGGIGLPVFATDGGLTGATGGYLAGFGLAATAISLAVGGHRTSYMRLLWSGLLGMGILLACGVMWRVLFFGGEFGMAVATGAWPFVTKAIVETALVATLVHRWRARVCDSQRSRSIHGV